MRSAFCTVGLAVALAMTSVASAQFPTNTTQQRSPGGSLPTFAGARLNMTTALGNVFGIRNLLPSFRDNGQITGTMTGVPDTSNPANYLKGFGYRRLP